jgi:acyl-CoA thioesterase-1
LDGIFNSVATQQPPQFWTPDGVHPSPAGHALIAKEWLRTMQCL